MTKIIKTLFQMPVYFITIVSHIFKKYSAHIQYNTVSALLFTRVQGAVTFIIPACIPASQQVYVLQQVLFCEVYSTCWNEEQMWNMQQTQKQKSNKNKTVFKRYINYIPVAFRKLIQINSAFIY